MELLETRTFKLFQKASAEYQNLQTEEDYNNKSNLDFNFEIAQIRRNIKPKDKSFNTTLGYLITLQYIQKMTLVKQSYLAMFKSLTDYSISSLFGTDADLNHDMVEAKVEQLTFKPAQMHHIQSLIRYKHINIISDYLGDTFSNLSQITDENPYTFEELMGYQIQKTIAKNKEAFLHHDDQYPKRQLTLNWLKLFVKQFNKINHQLTTQYQKEMRSLKQPIYIDQDLNFQKPR